MNSQNNETALSVCKRSILTGFIGGILWTMIGTVLAYFKFMQFAPRAILVNPWLKTGWASRWQGGLLAIFLAGILSIFVALVYFVLFRKLSSMWIGTIYGLLIWAVVFIIALPVIRSLPHFGALTKETLVTSACLYILFGVFVGFSISYDYEDTVTNSRTSRRM
ncbi:YqhR family membrane protein [Aciduricibacillus chroicocephali]|uniref:YqhR family membrane protein n=1 Tax=Aciduricibacillus chroicocephali TaxID=3054939 RepID=A0ABY9KUV7_9BACI|nr:YqhR family membrane protein [Bacillaceae bacterium 44XB]